MYKSHNPYDRASRSLAEREEALEELLRLTRKKYPPYLNERSCSSQSHRKQSLRKRPSCSHHVPEHYYPPKHDYYNQHELDDYYLDRKPDHTPRSRARTWLNKLFHSPPPEPKRRINDDLKPLKREVKQSSRPMIIPSMSSEAEQVVVVDIPYNATVVLRFLDDQDDSKATIQQLNDMDEMFKTMDIKINTKKSKVAPKPAKHGMNKYLSVPTELARKGDKKYHYFDSDDSVVEEEKGKLTASSSSSDFSSNCSTPDQDKKKLNRWMK